MQISEREAGQHAIIHPSKVADIGLHVYGKPKGSLRVATTRCFRKQRVALASQ